jgi:hypothetical protein
MHGIHGIHGIHGMKIMGLGFVVVVWGWRGRSYGT